MTITNTKLFQEQLMTMIISDGSIYRCAKFCGKNRHEVAKVKDRINDSKCLIPVNMNLQHMQA